MRCLEPRWALRGDSTEINCCSVVYDEGSKEFSEYKTQPGWHAQRYMIRWVAWSSDGNLLATESDGMRTSVVGHMPKGGGKQQLSTATKSGKAYVWHVVHLQDLRS